MNAFANLPAKLDGETMPTWDGDVSSIPQLLKDRQELADSNWFSCAPGILGNTLGSRPFVTRLKKQMKNIGQQLVGDEAVAQAEFILEIQKEYAKRLAFTEGSPSINTFDRSKKLIKLERLFSGSGIEGLPA